MRCDLLEIQDKPREMLKINKNINRRRATYIHYLHIPDIPMLHTRNTKIFIIILEGKPIRIETIKMRYQISSSMSQNGFIVFAVQNKLCK